MSVVKGLSAERSTIKGVEPNLSYDLAEAFHLDFTFEKLIPIKPVYLH